MKDNLKQIIVNIKEEIESTQIKTMLDVNRNLIILYFKLGKILYENIQYGNKFIEIISKELKQEYPNLRGFSSRNLRNMKQFYQEYKDDEIWQQLVAKLPWGHNLLLLEKIKDKELRKKYLDATIENGWSRSVLSFQIDTKYHLRIGNSDNNFNKTLSLEDGRLVNNIIKDPYIFEFILLKKSYKEKDLEIELINKIKNVLIEFGNGFCFVGNQYKIIVNNKEYFIDLLFYHLKLKCYVVIELKATKFIPEYVGKMNFYLSVVDELLKSEDDKPTIGIILCKEKNRLTAKYSLKNINSPIGISSYQLCKKLPNDILDKLPTEEILNAHISF